MAHQESIPGTVPVPPPLRRRLWYTVYGAGLFMTTSCVDGSQRPDFDAWHQSVSALSLGPGGWIQMVNFFLLGAVVLSTVAVWRRILAHGRGATAFPVLTALTGVSIIACGILPQDPAPGYDPMALALTAPTLPGLMHLLFAAVGALCSVASLLVMARRFAGHPSWRGWSMYSAGMAVAMVACVATYAVWSTSSSGYAGTFERLALAVAPAWMASFLVRLGRGVPFMSGVVSWGP